MTAGNGRRARQLSFTQAPRRVVSLVPSLTESLFDLGLGNSVVGITDYCVHPAEAVAGLPRLGGTKNPRVAEIVALQPDLVLANWEENPRAAVEELEANGIPVWVIFPTTVLEALEVLNKLVELFRSQPAALRVRTLEVTLEWAVAAVDESQTRRVFCPIWYEPGRGNLPEWWMTFNRRTYPSDLLHLLGGENVFAERERRYPLEADLGLQETQDPGERDVRYPRLRLEEIIQAQPDLILLPDEPFAFNETHRQQLEESLEETPAVKQGQVFLVEGSLLTWHGTRLARALRELPAILSS